MGDWLGTGTVANWLRKYRPFHEARAFVRKLNLKNRAEWRAYCKGEIPRLGRVPADIPVIAERTYASKGWNGMGDWLGTGAVAPTRRTFRPFTEARAFARKLKLKSESDWRAFCNGELPPKGRRPMDIPAHPERKYADKGWVSWGDWLGTGTVASSRRKFRPFREARAFARKLNLKSEAEWRTYCKGKLPQKARLPEDIPAHADRTYAGRGWVSWGDWLGTGVASAVTRQFLPFREARAFVRLLQLGSRSEWVDFCRAGLHHDIPRRPDRIYA
jgi:hypothetical protein